jgi:hypothetical protein
MTSKSSPSRATVRRDSPLTNKHVGHRKEEKKRQADTDYYVGYLVAVHLEIIAHITNKNRKKMSRVKG